MKENLTESDQILAKKAGYSVREGYHSTITMQGEVMRTPETVVSKDEKVTVVKVLIDARGVVGPNIALREKLERGNYGWHEVSVHAPLIEKAQKLKERDVVYLKGRTLGNYSDWPEKQEHVSIIIGGAKSILRKVKTKQKKRRNEL